MNPHGLGRTKVFRTAEDGGRGVPAVNPAGEGDPVGTGVIAFPAVFAVAGQEPQVDGLML